MKQNLLLFIILFPLSMPSIAADKKPVVYGGIKEVNNNPEIKDETLQKLLTVKGVDTQYKACQAEGVSIQKIPDCIWNGSGSVPPLTADVKKNVTQMYEQENNSRAPASEAPKSSNLTAKSKNIAVDYMNDPAVIALSEVFQKKLEEALLGDEKARKDTKVAIVDHSKFIDLYKTELGKTIVNSFTSYCMESEIDKSAETSNPDCEDDKKNKVRCPLYFLGKDPRETAADNVKKLKDLNLSSASDGKNPAPGASDSSKWTSCIASVSRVCYINEDNISNGPPPGSDIIKESKKRACTIMDYVKSARKNLIAADEQDKFYEGLSKNSVTVELGNVRTVEINEKNNMDAVTTATSKDIETSYEKKNKEVVEKEMADCYDNGQVKDTEKCKKFIETDPEEKKKALAEFGLRQYALGENMDEKLKDDNEVKKYLKEEGYDDKKITEMTANSKDIEAIRKEIKDRYTAEREAIIATMADKIDKKTTSGEGIDKTKDKGKLNDIRTEIAQRPDDLKQLVHFSNIVSSYLEIDSKGTKSRNVASLYTELNNTASKMNNVDAGEADALKKQAQQAGLKENKGAKDESRTTLGVDTLNTIFKYSTEK